MTTLIIGGTGNVGLPLLDSISGQQDFRALVQSDEDVARVRERDLEPVRGSLSEPDSLSPAFAGVERLFLLTPFVENQEQLEHAALDAAEAAGVEHVIKFGYAGLEWPIAITSAHRAIRDRLIGAPFASTLLLAEVFATNLLGQADLLRGGQLVLPGPDARIAYVDPADVGHVAGALLSRTDVISGTIVVTGPQQLTNQETADIAGRAYTGQSAVYTPAETAAFAQSLVTNGWPAFVADAVAEMHSTISEKGPIPISEATRTYLHREPTTLASFFERLLA